MESEEQLITFKTELSSSGDCRRYTWSTKRLTLEALQLLVQQTYHLSQHNVEIFYRDEEQDLISVQSELDLGEAVLLHNQPHVRRILKFVVGRPLTGAGEEAAAAPAPTQTAIQMTAQQGAAFMEAYRAPFLEILRSLGVNLDLSKQQSSGGSGGAAGNAVMTPDADMERLLNRMSLQNPAQHNAVCDHCEKRITGERYKCLQCADFDLCSDCEPLPRVHDEEHVFLKLKKPLPSVAPLLAAVGGAVHDNNNNNNTNIHSNAGGVPSPGATLYHAAGSMQGRASQASVKFVRDVTLTDGTHVPGGAQMAKTWRLKNTSSVAWPANTRMAFLGGDKMASEANTPVGAVAPGTEIDVAVLFTAPQEPGRYLGYYGLQDAVTGRRMGPRLWIDVVVPELREDAKEKPGEGEAGAMMVIDDGTAANEEEAAEQEKVRSETDQKLKALRDMGFVDEEANVAALKKAAGKLDEAVAHLV